MFLGFIYGLGKQLDQPFFFSHYFPHCNCCYIDYGLKIWFFIPYL